jgi:hypothetical protein
VARRRLQIGRRPRPTNGVARRSSADAFTGHPTDLDRIAGHLGVLAARAWDLENPTSRSRDQ